LLLLCCDQMLSGFQDALDDLTQHLTMLENELRRYKSVADLLVGDLQSNIDSTLASILSHIQLEDILVDLQLSVEFVLAAIV